jgi:adenylate cyclase
MIYTFNDFSLDPDRRELRRGADLIATEPQTFDLLQHLIQNRHRVVSKDEIFDAVWSGRIVSDSTLSSQISLVRQAIGDDGERQLLIRTSARKGYRFVGQVRENRNSDGSGAELLAILLKEDTSPSYSSDLTRPRLPNKPSIAVLPFTNMSDDPGQEYLADGIVEDIITELSRFSGLFVIARNSSFQWKGKAIDVREVGRVLGVRYVLEGSIRRAEDRIRISAQLLDAESAVHLWAEKYDHDYADIFALQDGIAHSVVGAIEPEILIGEGQRAVRKKATNLDAFDCCMRGMWYLYQLRPDDSRRAETWLRRSIELEPTLARAHSFLARTLSTRCWAGYSDDIKRDLQAGAAAAARAVELDDRDPASHYALAIHRLLARQHELALAAAQRSIELNPNFALGYFVLGEVHIFMGHFTEMLDPMLRCLRLSPRDPWAPLILSLVALAYYHLGSYKEAVQYSERALQRGRNYVGLRTLAATLGQLGRAEEARSVLSEMEKAKPTNAKEHWKITNPYADAAHERQLLDGLRRAQLFEN